MKLFILNRKVLEEFILSEKNSFVKQASVLAMASLLVRFLGFLYRLPLTKLIGDEGNGIYSAGYYLYTFFLIMSSAGLPAAISKMVSEETAKKNFIGAHEIFKTALILSGTIGFLASILIFFGAESFANIIGSPKSFYAILSLSPTVFIVAIMAVFRGYFQGLKNTWPTAISQVIEQIFNAVFSVWLAFILVKKNVALGAAGGTMGTGIGAFFGLLAIILIYFLKRNDIKKNFVGGIKKSSDKKKICWGIIKTSVPIIIGTAIFSLTNLIDMKMVMTCLKKNFSEQQANILYGQLTGKYVVLTTLPVSIATAIATAIIPNIASKFVLKDFENVKQKINTALRLTMILSIPAAIGMGVLGKEILMMLFPEYPGGEKLLIVGSISIIFLALAQIATGILQGINKLNIPAIAAFFGALIKIPLNYFLITNREINILGAVISTIFCYLIAGIFDLIVMSREIKFVPDINGFFVKPMIASIIMGFLCHFFYGWFYFLFGKNNLALLLDIFLAVIFYFIFLFLLGGIKHEDLKLMPMGNKIIFMIDKLRWKKLN